jgi:hypothetical protein
MSDATLTSAAAIAAYDDDFYAWTQEQARLLRAGRFSDLDIQNIAEELETLGRSDKREIRSRLQVVLSHLLKWRMQPDRRSSNWRGTITEQRRKLNMLLSESPSLRPFPARVLHEEYPGACVGAAEETGLPLEIFPPACPFTIAQVLDPAFLPGDPEA